MSGVRFSVADARVETRAATPTVVFRIRMHASESVHAALVRCQLQIEPRRRPHAAAEQERLADLFGEPSRWRDTLKPLIWAQTTLITPEFKESIEVDLPVACTYDFEVAAAKYLQALRGGEVPLLLLFSGTIFCRTETGFRIEPIAWNQEAAYRMPVQVWRDAMNACFPDSAWIRVRQESLDVLQRCLAQRGLTNWDELIDALVEREQAAAR